MASAQDYANWIVQNADKKGTPEFETVSKAYQAARAQSAPISAMGVAEEAGKGLLRGASDTALGVGKGVSNLLFGPIGGKVAEMGIDALSRPSRELVKANPANRAEQFAGTMGEIGGAGIVGGGASTVRNAVGTGLSALGGAIGEQVGGDTGKLIGTFSPLALTALKQPLQNAARSWMQSALKPTLSDLRTGKAARAIDTMLEEGVSPNTSGMEKLRGKIDDLNEQISNAIENSSAIVNKDSARKTLQETLNKFASQVNPDADIATIRNAWQQFKNHPYFNEIENNISVLEDNLKKATEAKISALQDAGKFQTFEAQQRNLAYGDNIRLASKQTPNTPYFNVGATKEVARSPSAFPVPGYPRVHGQYTENFQRIPEGKSAFEDAMEIFRQRSMEEASAKEALALAEHNRGGLPVQLAQQMKQTTGSMLSKKYGQMGTADVEAQKAIVRGLKEGIANAVPEVAPMNAKESDLINALKVGERRALMEANKNPGGLAWLAHNPKTWALFMADRSAAFKALVARALYQSAKMPIAPPGAQIVMGAQYLGNDLQQGQ